MFQIAGSEEKPIEVTLAKLTISGGAEFYGGGIRINVYATLSISDSTITGNSGEDGGGIYNDGTLTISTRQYRATQLSMVAEC